MNVGVQTRRADPAGAGAPLLALLAVIIAVGCRGTDGVESEPTIGAGPSERREEASLPSVALDDGTLILVEIAADDGTRAQGLMYRESLESGRGMLFLFPETGVYPFWMKNTFIPLDMIWIDEQGVVVHVERDVQPCTGDPCPSYPPPAPARFVLELGSGEASRFGIEEGKAVRLRNLEGIVPR